MVISPRLGPIWRCTVILSYSEHSPPNNLRLCHQHTLQTDYLCLHYCTAECPLKSQTILVGPSAGPVRLVLTHLPPLTASFQYPFCFPDGKFQRFVYGIILNASSCQVEGLFEGPQDHLQVLWFAKRTHRTPESCYILTVMIYYSEGHTLRSPMAMAHREESRRNQHEFPGALRQESYRTLPRPLTCWVKSLRHFLNKKYVTVLV